MKASMYGVIVVNATAPKVIASALTMVFLTLWNQRKHTHLLLPISLSSSRPTGGIVEPSSCVRIAGQTSFEAHTYTHYCEDEEEHPGACSSAVSTQLFQSCWEQKFRLVSAVNIVVNVVNVCLAHGTETEDISLDCCCLQGVAQSGWSRKGFEQYGRYWGEPSVARKCTRHHVKGYT